RFLGRIWRVAEQITNHPPSPKASADVRRSFNKGGHKFQLTSEASKKLRRKTHQTIKRVTEDIEQGFHFNTAISATMELVNEIYDAIQEAKEGLGDDPTLKEAIKTVAILLAPFVPHISEELWRKWGNKESIFKLKWPAYDKSLIIEEELELVIQINGRVRSKILVPKDSSELDVKEKVLIDEKIKQWIGDKPIKKFILVPDKLVNIVI
ncbi:leucine--tRNA ligase, partial [Candidatus Desantisbacteria bacterium CG_4_9_14_3_um_filter_50_7]